MKTTYNVKRDIDTMELDISGKFGSRLGVVILIFIFSTSGYASPLKTQSIQTLPGSTTSPTSTVGDIATENILLEPSPDSTIQPSNPLDKTIVPSEIVQEMLGQIEKEEAVLALRQLTGKNRSVSILNATQLETGVLAVRDSAGRRIICTRSLSTWATLLSYRIGPEADILNKI
jgi:hypothetical protein